MQKLSLIHPKLKFILCTTLTLSSLLSSKIASATAGDNGSQYFYTCIYLPMGANIDSATITTKITDSQDGSISGSKFRNCSSSLPKECPIGDKTDLKTDKGAENKDYIAYMFLDNYESEPILESGYLSCTFSGYYDIDGKAIAKPKSYFDFSYTIYPTENGQPTTQDIKIKFDSDGGSTTLSATGGSGLTTGQFFAWRQTHNNNDMEKYGNEGYIIKPTQDFSAGKVAADGNIISLSTEGFHDSVKDGNNTLIIYAPYGLYTSTIKSIGLGKTTISYSSVQNGTYTESFIKDAKYITEQPGANSYKFSFNKSTGYAKLDTRDTGGESSASDPMTDHGPLTHYISTYKPEGADSYVNRYVFLCSQTSATEPACPWLAQDKKQHSQSRVLDPF
ncbi:MULTISPECIES: hypothetical protein [Cysteiniphilum]|uniref:hypothetical protein n=1 Tax=Cysteiniphilum TaxID=2056696 RepID=UPI00177FAF42|nr:MULTISPECIES: hypothetical protein [Cysteiniphilum]